FHPGCAGACARPAGAWLRPGIRAGLRRRAAVGNEGATRRAVRLGQQSGRTRYQGKPRTTCPGTPSPRPRGWRQLPRSSLRPALLQRGDLPVQALDDALELIDVADLAPGFDLEPVGTRNRVSAAIAVRIPFFVDQLAVAGIGALEAGIGF